jgi:hypothetical protein
VSAFPTPSERVAASWSNVRNKPSRNEHSIVKQLSRVKRYDEAHVSVNNELPDNKHKI